MRIVNFIKLLGLTLFSASALSLSVAQPTNESKFTPLSIVLRENEGTETVQNTVVVPEIEHGKITVDKKEGEVGDVITLTVEHDLFYVIDFVAVNGVNLVEDENTTGKYTFALAEGENVITAGIKIDEELLGEFSTMIEQFSNKDWTHFFSVENVITVVSFLLNGGILISVIRYFIKDKRLEAKLEKWVSENLNKILPDATKEVVLQTIREFITPVFAQIQAENANMEEALTVFSRCLALAQENTPEAKIAITQELSSLKLSDQTAISAVEARLKAFIEEEQQKYADLVAKLDAIHDTNTAIIEEKASEKESEIATTKVGEIKETVDDGTQI